MVENTGFEPDGERSICGYAIEEIVCEAVKIERNPVIDAQFKIINQIKNLSKTLKPAVSFTLFELPENSPNSVVIRPTTISNISAEANQTRTFAVSFDLHTAETDKQKAYNKVMQLANVTESLIAQAKKTVKGGFRFTTSVTITSFDSAVLTLSISKTI